jgi:hypothetical protein
MPALGERASPLEAKLCGGRGTLCGCHDVSSSTCLTIAARYQYVASAHIGGEQQQEDAYASYDACHDSVNRGLYFCTQTMVDFYYLG